MAGWLVKTEPSEWSIDDFAREPDTPAPWDGVRNYQARNYLREMRPGDRVLVYHSSCRHIGVAGIVRVVSAPYPDPAQFDPDSPYYDGRSTRDNPRWVAVDMCFERRFTDIIALARLKATSGLEDLPLVKKGSRLSVMPVTTAQWQRILALEPGT